MHSETWWPRLFSHHAAVAWDDTHKDYSDLPPAVRCATQSVHVPGMHQLGHV